MSPEPRVDIADSSAEGERIVVALREGGLHVRERSVASLSAGSDAAILILAGDAPGAFEVLREIIADDRSSPVILVGAPPDDDLTVGDILSAGAEAYYPRPVPIERLVRKVESYVTTGEASGTGSDMPPLVPERTLQLGDFDTNWQAHEPTMHGSSVQHVSKPLPGSSSLEATAMLPEPEAGVERAESVMKPLAPPRDSASTSATDRPGSLGTATPEEADISPRIVKLMLDADRRVFPALDPIDLRFSAGEESAGELVPDEMLEDLVLPAVEPVAEDPLEGFTYVGPAPERAPAPPAPVSQQASTWATPTSGSFVGSATGQVSEVVLGSGGSQSGVVLGGPMRSGTESVSDVTGELAVFAAPRSRMLDDVGLGEHTEGGVGRHGSLGDADALRLLLRLIEAGEDITAVLTVAEGADLQVRIADGELVELSGDVALRVVRHLQSDSRAALGAASEPEAQALLDEWVASGRLGRFELDRLSRRFREEALHDVVAATSARFFLRPATGPVPSRRLLAAPLTHVLVEGARRRLTPQRVQRLLGSHPVRIRLLRGAPARMAGTGLEPELCALVERHDDRPLESLLSAASAEEGVAGAIYALIVSGAVGTLPLEAPEGPQLDGPQATREAVVAAHARAREADYFSVLGTTAQATPRELRAAYAARRKELGVLNLRGHGLERLEPLRVEALLVVDEAWEVLRDDQLRFAYVEALGL